jgi:hypothetical protein
MTGRKWRWAIAAAILWYCCWAILFIQAKPGFHYDEAIDVLGSVSELHSHHELTLPHAPDTWFCVSADCFPLMSARYIGSIKEYLCWPLFAIFGPKGGVVRLLAMTLGSLGILGIARLLASQAGYGAAAAGAWVLALNPSYLDMTILDNSAFSPWMGVFGLLCIAAAGYLEKRSARAAFWLGAAAGLGVWARANYVWLLGALAAAVVISLGRRILVPWKHFALFVIGGIFGGSAFLAYQILSGGGTWQAVSMFGATGTLLQRIQHRAWMFSETLLSNGEHHRAWAGPVSLPAWQLWFFPLLVAASCVMCVLSRRTLARVAGLMLLFYAMTFMYTSLPIGEHHLMTLVPIAAVVAVLAWQRFSPAAIAVGLIYVVSAIYWQGAALAGLRRTGGVGPWSDGIYTLTERLRADFPGREIKVLDWGLQNSIYVLSNSELRSRELFWDSTESKTDTNEPWIEAVRHGGVFLLNGPQNRMIPAASVGFLRALAEGRPTVRRFVVPQRSGIPYAEVIDILPDTLGSGPAPPADPSVPKAGEIRASDPDFLKQAAGFYQLEQGGWRWTEREFSLALPAGRKGFTIHVNVPEAEIQKLGAISMTMKVGAHVLAPETFSHAGDFHVTRILDTGWGNQVDFSVDKTLPPTAGDPRQLGIIFVGIRIDYGG